MQFHFTNLWRRHLCGDYDGTQFYSRNFYAPLNGIANGGQPVISFNYGAKKNDRVKAGIRFITLIGCAYTLIVWAFIVIFPRFWFSIFSNDMQMTNLGIDALKIYFFWLCFMSFQFAGQHTFQALGDAKHAIFFSLLRKAIIVVPLTLLFTHIGIRCEWCFS